MKVLDLFCGAGGASLGLHRAGLEHVAAVDFDEAACATMRAAFGDDLFGRAHPAIGSPHPGLVRWMRVEDFIAPRAWVWWASPPCQGFSHAGDRLGPMDPRNGFPALFRALDRAVADGHGPRWLLFENVRGLLSHNPGHDESCGGCYFEVVLGLLRERFVAVDHRIINSADHGVPQTRQRVYVVAGPRAIDWPAPTHAKDGEGGLLPWVSMGEALGYADAVIVEPELDARPDWWHGASRADGPSRSVGSRANASIRGSRPEQLGPQPELLRLPSPTVSATEVKGAAMSAEGVRTSQGGLQRASDALQLGAGIRRLTVEECAVLQDFPAGWPFQGNADDRYRCVGNACTSRVVEALARAVIAADGAS